MRRGARGRAGTGEPSGGVGRRAAALRRPPGLASARPTARPRPQCGRACGGAAATRPELASADRRDDVCTGDRSDRRPGCARRRRSRPRHRARCAQQRRHPRLGHRAPGPRTLEASSRIDPSNQKWIISGLITTQCMAYRRARKRGINRQPTDDSPSNSTSCAHNARALSSLLCAPRAAGVCDATACLCLLHSR